MIKDMIVSLSIDAGDDTVANYAISLAREFNAHLAAVAFAYETVPIAVLGDDGSPELIERLLEEAENSAKSAVARFESAIRGSGILAEARWMTTSFPGAGDTFGRIARRFGLSIVGQTMPDDKSPKSLIIEAALFDSGRPVLVVPFIQTSGVKLDRIMVCWDGSRGAARAVNDALSFLKRARIVEVVVVGDRPKSGEIPGADIAHHLARQEVNVEVNNIIAADIDAANIILSHASDLAADFLVMGGYGHSRLRELVLGGVTRSILATMTIPVLMSH